MAYTFTDMSKMSNDILGRGVVDMILSEDTFTQLMAKRAARLQILTEPRSQVPLAKSYSKFDGGHKKFEVD